MSGSSSANSFVCFGCVNFANNQRLLAYHQWACANNMYPAGGVPVIENTCSCPADDDTFVDPITDNVCWYDPAVPESSEFLGVLVMKITGLKNSTFSREVQDAFLTGSVLSRPRLRGRSFGFEVLLVATSCEGMDYGTDWLRSILEEGRCATIGACNACEGQELTVRVHCATDEVADEGTHVWQSVGLVDGLQVVDDGRRARESCCVLKSATFTMQSESPYSYSQEPLSLCELVADPDTYVRCYDWNNDCIDCEEDCCDRCGFDGLCQCYSPTPIEPDIVSVENCYCTPVAKIVRSCCVGSLPNGYDTAFKVDVYSGTDWSDDHYREFGMRNFSLQLYDNPLGLDCITDDETYAMWCLRAAPCAEIHVAYVPSDSNLVIDGRNNKVTLNCDGVCRPYRNVVSSITGPLFPLISRCQPLMFVASFDYYATQIMPTAPGVAPASVSIESFLRFRN